jgi:signal transduction histidine kinase/CheY-like chemotaxis protein
VLCVLYEDVTELHQLELELERTTEDLALASRLLRLYQYFSGSDSKVRVHGSQLMKELGYRNVEEEPTLLRAVHPADVAAFLRMPEGGTVTVRLRANQEENQWHFFTAICTRVGSDVRGFLFSVQQLTYLQSECQTTRACFRVGCATNSLAFWAISLSPICEDHPVFETKSIEFLQSLVMPGQSFNPGELFKLKCAKMTEVRMRMSAQQPYEWFSVTFIPCNKNQVLCFAFNMNERKTTHDLLVQTQELLDLAGTYGNVRMWTFEDTHRDELSVFTISSDFSKEIRMDWGTLEHNVTFESQAAVRAAFQRALLEGTPLEIEVPFFFNSVKWFLLRGFATEDEGRRRLIGIYFDTTAIKEAADQLQLEKAAAEEAMMAKSTFLANVTHEIRAPLNGICGLLEMLISADLSPEQLELASTIQNSFYELNELLNDTLDLAKLESHRLMSAPGNFDPCEVAFTLQETLFLRNPNSSTYRIWTDPEQPILFRGDPHIMLRILGPLVSNAIKFTKGGWIEVRVSSDGDRLVVQVSDTGVGMTPSLLTGIRNHFDRDDSIALYENACVGVGLSLVTELVRFVNGTISIDTEEDVGTTVVVTLPWPPIYYPWFLREPKIRVKSLLLVNDEYNRELVRRLQTFYQFNVIEIRSLDEVNRCRGWNLLFVESDTKTYDYLTINLDTARQRIACLTNDELPQRLQGKVDVFPKPVRVDLLRTFFSGLAFAQVNKRHGTVRNSVHPAIPDCTGIHVLAVDDNSTNQLVIRQMLRKLGCTFKIASNGAEAIAALETETFSIVLMDQSMPVLDGPEATRRIRRMKVPWASVPIIAMTASNLQEDEQTCLEAGMNGFLSKPVTVRELATVLDRMRSHREPSG